MLTDRLNIEAAVTQPGRKWGYAAIAVVVVVIALGVVGWNWRSGVQLTSIEIASACENEWRLFSSSGCSALNSTADEIRTLVGASPGDLLYELDPLDIVERVERHPWIRTATMDRTPGGRLVLTVAERTPVLLEMRGGRPAHYVDAEGYRMPFVAGVAYDVPLLHGLTEPFDALAPVKNPVVLQLASLLVDMDPSVQALLSEIDLGRSSEVVFHTAVLDSRGSIEVRMDMQNIEEQLTRLHAFWHQALLPDPGRSIQQIDLRFDSQIVTR